MLDCSAQQLQQIAQFSESYYSKFDASHDFAHIQRVVFNAQKIAEQEFPNFIHIGLAAAYLHDVGDHKYHNNFLDEWNDVSEFLKNTVQLETKQVEVVQFVVQHSSFSKGFKPSENTIEHKLLQIIQDADRLDAIGAIGIARTFAFSGHKKHPFYLPGVDPNTAESKLKPTTVNHFYEKLLQLKDGMHTKSGRIMAAKRHDFMVQFLNELNTEINFNVNLNQ